MKSCSLIRSLIAVALVEATVTAATVEVTVDRPSHLISPTLWGIFFEDINCSADGGVYAEQIRNRSFEDSDKPEHWALVTSGMARGQISVSVENPMNPDLLATRNRRSLKLRIDEATSASPVGVVNEGFWGIALQSGAQYDLSLSARAADGFSGPLTISLQRSNGAVLAQNVIPALGADWKNYQLQLTATATEPKARLIISGAHAGTIWLDMVSLFPHATWNGSGLRPDLLDKLAGLQPAFNRFPGGCWVEGDTMKEAYRWKDTVGDISLRRTQRNIWQYWATHGLGFHEYLVMTEQLKAEPLFVVNCGMSHKENVPLDQLAPYIQDALDAIEYCNGPATSRYGALRAANGHPAPFNLKYLEVGNENGGPAYSDRWAAFHKAIKARYPELILIANHWLGNYPRNVTPEVVDEHFYDTPEFFMAHATHFDKYDRKGPKVYVGEYAVTRGSGEGNLRAAIGEAAFMTGLERNSDVVVMASYAPLFANVNYKKWNPDLICYDSSRSYGLPSYYVQQMFARNRGDEALPVQVTAPTFQIASKGGAIGVGTWNTRAEFKDVKVVVGGQPLFSSDFSTGSKGWRQLGDGQWAVKDGAFVQSAEAENVRAVAGDKAWKNYTLTLKARKLGGEEGFLILFNVQNDSNKAWWNIGGWGNTRHAIELGGMNSSDVTGSIETGRWYDIKVETSDVGVKCFLDGKLIHDAHYPELNSLYASASREQASGDLILKVVNAAQQPVATDLKMSGAARLAPVAKVSQLTSVNGEDENSLEAPTKVLPKALEWPVVNGVVAANLPANSFSVIRIAVAK